MEKKIIVRIVVIAVFALVVIVGFITATAADEPDGSSPEMIISFLNDNGYTVSSPITKEITIPEEFGEVYENYNRLQKEQGFDLSRYKGKPAVSYTFTVIGYTNENGVQENNVQVHVLVYDGRIIGGDIASTELDGFMVGIR